MMIFLAIHRPPHSSSAGTYCELTESGMAGRCCCPSSQILHQKTSSSSRSIAIIIITQQRTANVPPQLLLLLKRPDMSTRLCSNLQQHFPSSLFTVVDILAPLACCSWGYSQCKVLLLNGGGPL